MSGCGGIVILLSVITFFAASIALTCMIVRKINDDIWLSESRSETCIIINYTLNEDYYTTDVYLNVNCSGSHYSCYIGSKKNTTSIEHKYPVNSNITAYINSITTPHIKINTHKHHILWSSMPYDIILGVSMVSFVVTVLTRRCKNKEYEELE